MQTAAYPVARNDLERSLFSAHLAAEAETAEDGIIRDDRGSGAQRTAVAKVGLRRVIPGTAVMRLSKPRHAIGRRLEPSTRPTIIRFARKPVAEAGFLRACIHQRPRAKYRGESKADAGIGLLAVMQRVVEHTPATHRRHVGEREPIAPACPIVAAIVVVGFLDHTAAEEIRADLCFRELSGV